MGYVISTGSTGTGVRYALTGDHLQVTNGAIVASSDASAVTSTLAGNSISVQGTISAALNGIEFLSPMVGAGHRITVFASGTVQGVNTAISLRGTTNDISNWGVIDGGLTGVQLSGSGVGPHRIVNFGIITAGSTAISLLGSTPLKIENAGTISAPMALKVANGATVNLINTGDIYGDVRFGNGSDYYDGVNGTVSGIVAGGGGNDRFRAGLAEETFDGGIGFDTVVFAGQSAVWASLDGYDLQLGASAEDVYISIEALTGAGGDDILSGSAEANALAGRSGNDQLLGLEGNDTLTGGRGADTLTGGAGADLFVFTDWRDQGDTITDFAAGVDKIQISRAAFGLTDQPAGPLSEALFSSPEAPNPGWHFLYAGGPLYFDRDGSGTEYSYIKLVTLNAAITAADIILV